MISIRSLIEDLELLTERKDHLIKKLKNLSDAEKDKLIDFFNKKPNLEGKINWNNKNLTFDDFKDVMATTKTERERNVKKSGIKGMKKGVDYLELKIPDDFNVQAFIPLHLDASILIASKRIGNCEGKWCVAFERGSDHWEEYIYNQESVPVYFITDKTKYALMIYKNAIDSIWDAKDNNITQEQFAKGIGIKKADIKAIFQPNTSTISKARKILDETKPSHWFEQGLEDGTIKVGTADYEINNGFLTWYGGTWISGNWYGGAFLDGIWKDGIWHRGRFEGGIWKKGIWKDGIFKDGVWVTGVWEDGEFWRGAWKSGIWKGGKWRPRKKRSVRKTPTKAVMKQYGVSI